MGHFLPLRPPSWCELPRVPSDFVGPLSVVIGVIALLAVMVASPEGPDPLHQPVPAAIVSSAAVP